MCIYSKHIKLYKVYVKLSKNYYQVGWVGDSLRFSPSFNQILIVRLVVLFPSFFLCFCLVHVDLGCPNEGGVSVDFSFLSLICDSATIFFMGCPSIEFYLNLYLVFSQSIFYILYVLRCAQLCCRFSSCFCSFISSFWLSLHLLFSYVFVDSSLLCCYLD